MAAPTPLPSKGIPAQTHEKNTITVNLSGADSGSNDVNLENEVYDFSDIDPILAKKMALINNALDEIGMTPFQWKLFFLNGFGYAVDSVSCFVHLVLKSLY